jgi:hypothetical protein
LKKGDDHPDVIEVQNFLKCYGYLHTDEPCVPGSLDVPTSQAVARFQEWFQVNVTGDLDNATKQVMTVSRCGLPDVPDALGFSTLGPWEHNNLTYSFGNLSRHVDSAVARNAIRRALDTWTNTGVGLTFTEVLASQGPGIFIEWRPANDPDHSMVGGVLAHADFPPGFSIIVNALPLPLHYDDQEHIWADQAVPGGYDIETVALHELGHCLGLQHTSVQGSVMFPTVTSNLEMRSLKPDDLAGIRSLYHGSNPAMFSPVYAQGDPGAGISNFDLKSPADRAFAFDYNHSGKLDHICLYRPGTGTFWILKNSGGSFQAVYAQGDPGAGIGSFDLKSPADRAFAFDYDHSGKLDHICLYRPGTGTFWILKNSGGSFQAVYAQGDPGAGIGGFDLRSPVDQVFPYDFDGTGMLDHLALYRPGTGTMWILHNRTGKFIVVYSQGDPGQGIGGYDLRSQADHAFAFDYSSNGRLNHLVLIRPGTGTIWILKKN